MWRWHNRGRFWDKVAAEWAGNDDWTNEREREREARHLEMGEILFVTFALRSVKHSTMHRTSIGRKKKGKVEGKAPRLLGPGRCVSPHSQCGANGSNVWRPLYCSIVDQWPLCSGPKIQRNNRPHSKTLHSWWKRKTAFPISQIDGYVKHIFRKHNQEADHWANGGADGQRKIFLIRKITLNNETVTWLLGWNLRSMAEVVVVLPSRRQTKDKRITISKVAVLRGVCTALTAEEVVSVSLRASWTSSWAKTSV